MKYMGSKNRYYKEILPIILHNRRDGQCYVEPFVGGVGRFLLMDIKYLLVNIVHQKIFCVYGLRK